jgi:hypothetical protein
MNYFAVIGYFIAFFDVSDRFQGVATVGAEAQPIG